MIMKCLAIALTCGVTGIASANTALTVYNDNRAVVKHTDTMSFQDGLQTKTYGGVPERIDPTSVRFSVNNGDVQILEQNYRYDIVNSMKVLRTYLDRNVTIWLSDERLVEGVLQSVSGDVIIRGESGSIHILKNDVIERYDLPELPGGLVTRPTLFWMVQSEGDKNAETELSYITNGIGWHAEYNAVISDDEKSIELSSWVSVENNSGAAYDDAVLKLVAGDLHRAPQPQNMMVRSMPQVLKAEDTATGFQERGLFEYHLYDLGRSTSIANGEIKQISLFEPSKVASRKVFSYDPRKNSEKVAVTMEFTNSERDGLGMPLPAGTMRVYKRDTDDSLELVGEDSIDHTPRNEDVMLTVGYAFDLVAERRIVNVERISQRIQEQIIEITLTNRKDEAVEITATDYLYGDWTIIHNSHEYDKKDAMTVEFAVDVPADSETVITYTARIQ